MASISENQEVPRPKTRNATSNQVVERRPNRRILGDIGNVVAAMPAANKQASATVKNTVTGNRPVTRRYAAALLSRDQNMEDSDSSRNSSVADVQEDHQMLSESAQSEDSSALECCEIEMQDSYDSIYDCDEEDSGDPLAVVEYVQDIYDSYRILEKRSCVPPTYMSMQTDINEKMRGILIDWLIEVHQKFQLMEETLYLTVNIIDRYLSRQKVMRRNLQLVGVTAMFIACKYEEVSVPIADDFVVISDNAYTRQQLLQMEKSILNVLQFALAVPTPYKFVTRFLKAAQSDNELEAVTFFLIDLSLVEYAPLSFQPSLLAAAAIFTAQCTLRRSPYWNKTMEWYTGYSEHQLWDCAQLMVNYHKKAAEGKLTTVHKKYSLTAYNCAAKTQPAVIIREEMII